MNTNMTGFRWFSKILHLYALDGSSQVKAVTLRWYIRFAGFMDMLVL